MIVIASDHGGYALKQELMAHLKEKGVEFEDIGTYSEASCNYPEYAERAARGVAEGKYEKGILVCGTGIGMSRRTRSPASAARCCPTASARRCAARTTTRTCARSAGVSPVPSLPSAWSISSSRRSFSADAMLTA